MGVSGSENLGIPEGEHQGWAGRQGLGRSIRLSHWLWGDPWHQEDQVRLGTQETRHILWVPPHSVLGQGRSWDKVLAVGHVPGQLGAWGLSSRELGGVGRGSPWEVLSPTGAREPAVHLQAPSWAEVGKLSLGCAACLAACPCSPTPSLGAGGGAALGRLVRTLATTCLLPPALPGLSLGLSQEAQPAQSQHPVAAGLREPH